jgi:hypothetical protein
MTAFAQSAVSMAAEPEPAVRVSWSEVLVTEVSRRLAVLVDEARSAAGTDPLLKGVVITDAEVDELLAAPTGTVAPHAGGSLAQLVENDAPESSAHLLALRRRFGLGGFEMDCLLVCLAAEAAPRFERVFAYLNDAVAARQPGADILLRLVAPGDLSSQALLRPGARLLRYGLLVRLDPGDAARSGGYQVADGVARYAFEQPGVDDALARAWCDTEVPPLATALWDAAGDSDTFEALLRLWLEPDAARPGPLVVGLRAREGSGRRHLVECACRRSGLGCIALDAQKLPAVEAAQAALTAAVRDSALWGAAVLVHHADAWAEDPKLLTAVRAHLRPLVRELAPILVFASEAELDLAAWFPAARVLDVALPPPAAAARESAWRWVLGQLPEFPEGERGSMAGALGGKFRLTHGELALAAQRVSSLPVLPADPAAWDDLLHRVAGDAAAPRLARLARPLAVRHTLDDLVLPADRMEALRDVVRRVRHRRTVLEHWGLDAVSDRGRGLVALFHGPSGTGKTLAAEAVAGELRMRLYRIDLAGVVSKYIGETEKNLRAVFDEAERADAVLFFDEADALFGKRSEVKDSHDRYANIEISYLLQRMEEYRGLAILTTNLKQAVDAAFLRRIRFMVQFASPDAGHRAEIWRRIYPAVTPTDGLEPERLAQLNVTGGSIRNIAVNGAFLAAQAGEPVRMCHLLQAARTECAKIERALSDQEVEGWV